MNNATIVLSLAKHLDGQSPLQFPIHRRQVRPQPCLPARLPSSAFMQREADDLAPKALHERLHHSPPYLDQENSPGIATRMRRTSSTSSESSSSKPRSPIVEVKFWKEPESFEVLRAVEKKDIVFLMEIRDRAFQLLLRKSGDVTPLLHAMRIGPSHRDVAIVLLGAFSRYVNHLADEDIPKSRTKTMLKALRANLKLAIDYGLANSQSDLTASFMQTLVMSEGDKWVGAQVATVSGALKLGAAGQAVRTADSVARKFATKELGKADLIATLEDYLCNATVDLLMLASWSNVLESIKGDPIPTYYFARDDRVYKAFVDRLDQNKTAIVSTLNRRLKWQLRVLRTTLEGRATTYRRKVEILINELDEGEGI